MVRLAEKNSGTIVPNYTNGVAAQPNSYGHYLLGHVAGLERDAQRLRETYTRLDLSPMGTTVVLMPRRLRNVRQNWRVRR